ncbi:N-acetylglutamate synthase-like GNAT family acetyltransferase [Thermosporothrix hazakensis]|uniref:N-acetylglutamate synthase-like GNAT family acetyltransferase n=1 Tax=Thermosporothrix hazakensis TaxID=644383 RepID=A0A326UML2_THEHA|nr:GNAT family N-acetyltransferase [Thermosporothrix hazakensis]PZW31145.1 N-acetylglutamate synthase-like GNAT family acetyltransferase [Thermosporothrix hazakensis]GCE50943.1 N-acetyltransferase [Thermosporothrix hazakensis]
MAEYTVRKAGMQDCDAIVQLRIRLFKEVDFREGGEPSQALFEQTKQYIQENIASGKFHSWIAEAAAGEIVAISGMVLLEKPPSRFCPSGLEAYIMNMYTLPGWRGKGIATALMNRIIEYAKQVRASRVFLHTTDAGRHVYERCGFRPTHDDLELLL